MELNEAGFDVWIQALLGGSVVALFLSGTIMAFGRLLRERRERRQLELLRGDEAHVFAWLEGRSQQAGALKRTSALRDFLVRLSAQLDGDLRSSLLALYAQLGFASKDLVGLKSRSFQRRVDALQRARSLHFPLPDEAWPLLLKRGGPGWRWAVLELLVQVKGKDSLPWLFAFSIERRGRRKGMWTHLFISVARRSPEVTPFLLGHLNDPFFQQICLEVLAAYPAPEAGEAIQRLADAASPLTRLRACIRALEVHPSPAAMEVLEKLAAHDDDDVRRLVAKALHAWQADESALILDSLTIDLAYRVREAAVQALAAGGPMCNAVLDGIGLDSEHPAFRLAAQQRQLTPYSPQRSDSAA